MNRYALSASRRRNARTLKPGCERLETREVPATLLPGFAEAAVATGLSRPTSMEFSPDGALFITEQAGTIEVYRGGNRVRADFFQNAPLTVDSEGERGLLGLAFDPNFASNRYVYVYYTTTAADHRNRVSRFTAGASGDLALAGSEQVILELDPHPVTNHNGGAIHFGPDGKLYVATGDSANGDNAQSLANRHGKILRINADGSIPADNPFVNQAAGANRAIWALGLRNPYTFAFQPGTGAMFINDVGANAFEEINLGVAGANYGWPRTEGDFDAASNPNFTRPIYAYAHGSGPADGFAITGGAFYNPANPGAGAFPASYSGDYFFADVIAGWIHVRDAATGAVTGFASGIRTPVNLQVAADGSLYYLNYGAGEVFRVTSNNTPTPQPPTPGLRANFYDLAGDPRQIPDLDALTPAVTRTLPRIQQAPTRRPWAGLGLDNRFADTFAARITGYLRVDRPGIYRLTLRSDDGARLTIGGKVVLNNDGRGARSRTVTLNLSAGYHAIRVDYFERRGSSNLSLNWTGPGLRRPVAIPASQFTQDLGSPAAALGTSTVVTKRARRFL